MPDVGKGERVPKLKGAADLEVEVEHRSQSLMQ
jgi:hypothetical protein